MKIISKFRDFYDYKVTKYGVDEKLVYTRKTYCEYFESLVIDVYTASGDRISEENFNKNLKENFEYFKGINFHKILILGEKLIHLFFTENGVYTHFDIKNENDLRKLNDFQYKKEITFKNEKKFSIFSKFGSDWDNLLSFNRKKLITYDIDKYDIILNEPILLIELIGTSKSSKYLYIYKFTYNPNLSQMGVYIDADFVWQSLVEFLSNKRSEKEISPEVSNENKILSKGFDLKTSFRPNMKKKK